jgi:hypothetical protein
MPQGMGYPKGDMVMKKGSRTMSEMMGVGKPEPTMKKKPSSKAKMMEKPASKAEMMRGKKPMFPFKKGGK